MPCEKVSCIKTQLQHVGILHKADPIKRVGVSPKIVLFSVAALGMDVSFVNVEI